MDSKKNIDKIKGFISLNSENNKPILIRTDYINSVEGYYDDRKNMHCSYIIMKNNINGIHVNECIENVRDKIIESEKYR